MQFQPAGGGDVYGEQRSPSSAIPIGGSQGEDVHTERQNNQAVLFLPLTWPPAGFQDRAILTLSLTATAADELGDAAA